MSYCTLKGWKGWHLQRSCQWVNSIQCNPFFTRNSFVVVKSGKFSYFTMIFWCTYNLHMHCVIFVNSYIFRATKLTKSIHDQSNQIAQETHLLVTQNCFVFLPRSESEYDAMLHRALLGHYLSLIYYYFFYLFLEWYQFVSISCSLWQIVSIANFSRLKCVLT